MAGPMTARLAVDALPNAVALRHPSGTVVHLDRGSQFRSHAYLRALRGAGLHGSMGRVGACADNAAMETLFSLLQNNVLNRRRWATASSCGWRSWSGSSAPTTATDAKTALDGSPRSPTRHPYAPLTPHGSTYPTESTKVGGRPLNLGPHPYQLNAGKGSPRNCADSGMVIRRLLEGRCSSTRHAIRDVAAALRPVPRR